MAANFRALVIFILLALCLAVLLDVAQTPTDSSLFDSQDWGNNGELFNR